jgi:phosphoribosylformylglycinamidine synthase subunit PurQ / glutaminase
MKSAVIVYPGSNCDRDVQVALKKITGAEPLMVWHGDADFAPVDLITIPGGFAYGDYLRSGAMAARSPVMKEVVRRAKAGVAVLGICNGFQILTETGLLPGALMRNRGLEFLCRDVLLRVEDNRTCFTRAYEKGQVIKIPIAHHDGNYFAAPAELEALEKGGRVVFRYCDPAGKLTAAANVNGSTNAIAGIINAGGNVLGLMPHPERLIEPELGGADGRGVFESLMGALPLAA